MQIFSRRIFSLILALLISDAAHTENTSIYWKKINDKNGIAVYSTEIHGSEILKIKTRAKINASILEIQSILDNVEHRSNWIPYLKESSVIENISITENIEYSLFSAPWPASNRDFVYKLTRISNNKSNAIYKMKSITHAKKPEDGSMIRADLMDSTYILTALSEKETRVELIFHADPKGWLPNWIINIIQRILPYLILKNLRQQVIQTESIEQ